MESEATVTPATLEEQKTAEIVRRLIKAGTCMELEIDVILSAALCFHNFQDKFKVDNGYYQDVLSATCLLVASKTFETPIDLRILASIYYKILTEKNVDICRPKKEFEVFVTSVLRQELFLLRVLKFQIPRIVPIQYLLYYLKSLAPLFPTLASNHPLVRYCIMLLVDCHCSSVCIRHSMKHLAIAVIYVAFFSYGIKVPGTASCLHLQWAQCFAKDIDIRTIWAVINDIMNMYS